MLAPASNQINKKYLSVGGGFTTLLGVLILSAISLTAVITILLQGINSTQISLTEVGSKEALSFANACAEEALETIREDNNYLGSNMLNFASGNCSFSVADIGDTMKSIASSGSNGKIIRKVEVVVDKMIPQVSIKSWQEVADF